MRAPFPTRPAALLLALAMVGAAGATGCGKRKGKGKNRQRQEQPREYLEAEIKGGTYIVEDLKGTPVMRATADKTVGETPTSGGKASGPVTFTNANCLMFKNGKADTRIKAPHAVWQDGRLTADQSANVETVDGKMKAEAKRVVWFERVTTMYDAKATMFKKGKPTITVTAPESYYKENHLYADKTAHAETPDGTMRLDAQKAVYDDQAGRLVLTTATGQEWKDGKQRMAADGPRAEYQNDVLFLPASGTARQLEDGATIRGDMVRWNRATGKIEATGNVQIQTPTMRAQASRFTGSSTLKKGRLWGKPRPRVWVSRRGAGGAPSADRRRAR